MIWCHMIILSSIMANSKFKQTENFIYILISVLTLIAT